MKRKVSIIISLILVVGLAGYLYYDGFILYKIQKAITPPLKMIEYYSEKKFPEETVVESVEFENFGDIGEAMNARLTVPEDTIDELFPENTRDYKNLYNSYIPKEERSEVYFQCSRYGVVRRKSLMTQRTISFHVLKPKNDTVKVYVSIGELGMLRYSEWKL